MCWRCHDNMLSIQKVYLVIFLVFFLLCCILVQTGGRGIEKNPLNVEDLKITFPQKCQSKSMFINSTCHLYIMPERADTGGRKVLHMPSWFVQTSFFGSLHKNAQSIMLSGTLETWKATGGKTWLVRNLDLGYAYLFILCISVLPKTSVLHTTVFALKSCFADLLCATWTAEGVSLLLCDFHFCVYHRYTMMRDSNMQ